MGRLIARLALVAVAVAAATVPAPGAAQSRLRLAERCTATLPSAGGCRAGALAAEAVAGGVGLALAGGNEFPGTSSTMGFRFGTTPRVAGSLRLGVVDVSLPALDETGAELHDVSSWIPSVQAGLAVALFDGFRPRPTVGGVLAVDGLVTGGVAFLPSGGGYDGSVAAFGYGVRLGLLRESFTLPGVTASVVRRHAGSVEWSGLRGALPRAVALDGVRTTSVRATVGRELMALGLQVGFGWDRATADGALQPSRGGGPVSFGGLTADRTLFYGGVTATWLVTQLHGEIGYASGYKARTDGAGRERYDPTAGSLLATLTFRALF